MATEPAPTPPLEPEQRYRALRTVAAIIRIFAFLVGGLGALGVLIGAVVAGTQEDGGVGSALVVLIGGGLYVGFIALFLFAYGELIRLIIAVEENTRRTAEVLAGRGGALP